MASHVQIRGVGRLRNGERTLGNVGYALYLNPSGQAAVVKFDPMPNGLSGDVFHLTLEDGRILECQLADGCAYCGILGDGPRPERRLIQRGWATGRHHA